MDVFYRFYSFICEFYINSVSRNRENQPENIKDSKERNKKYKSSSKIKKTYKKRPWKIISNYKKF